MVCRLLTYFGHFAKFLAPAEKFLHDLATHSPVPSWSPNPTFDTPGFEITPGFNPSQTSSESLVSLHLKHESLQGEVLTPETGKGWRGLSSFRTFAQITQELQTPAVNVQVYGLRGVGDLVFRTEDLVGNRKREKKVQLRLPLQEEGTPKLMFQLFLLVQNLLSKMLWLLFSI